MKFLIIPFLILFSINLQAQDDYKSQVKKLLDGFVSAYNSRDTLKLREMLGENVVFNKGHDTHLKGIKEVNLQLIENLNSSKAFKITAVTESDIIGNLAMISGNWSSEPLTGDKFKSGIFTFIWSKSDAGYKLKSLHLEGN